MSRKKQFTDNSQNVASIEQIEPFRENTAPECFKAGGQEQEGTNRAKEATLLASKLRKEFKKVQLKRSKKMFTDAIKEFPQYEAEFKMMRAELLEPTARRDNDTFQAKSNGGASTEQCSSLMLEMINLANEAVTAKPNWIGALEKYAGWLWKEQKSIGHAYLICDGGRRNLQNGVRPADDKILQIFEDEDFQINRMLNLDDSKDVEYLQQRLSILMCRISCPLGKLEESLRRTQPNQYATIMTEALQIKHEHIKDLMTAVCTRRNYLIMLYQQAKNKQTIGGGMNSTTLADAEQDEARKIVMRKQRDAEAIRAKAEEIMCLTVSEADSASGTVPASETMTRNRPSAMDQKRRCQRKLAEKKQALVRNQEHDGLNGEDLFKYLRTLSSEEMRRNLKISLPSLLAELEKVFQQECQSNGQDIRTVGKIVRDLTSIYQEDWPKGSFLARSFDGQFKIFASQHSLDAVTLFYPFWRFYVRSVKSDLLHYEKLESASLRSDDLLQSAARALSDTGLLPSYAPWANPPFLEDRNMSDVEMDVTARAMRRYALQSATQKLDIQVIVIEVLQGLLNHGSESKDLNHLLQLCSDEKKLEQICVLIYNDYIVTKLSSLQSKIMEGCALLGEMESSLQSILNGDNASEESAQSLFAALFDDPPGRNPGDILRELFRVEKVADFIGMLFFPDDKTLHSERALMNVKSADEQCLNGIIDMGQLSFKVVQDDQGIRVGGQGRSSDISCKCDEETSDEITAAMCQIKEGMRICRATAVADWSPLLSSLNDVQLLWQELSLDSVSDADPRSGLKDRDCGELLGSRPFSDLCISWCCYAEQRRVTFLSNLLQDMRTRLKFFNASRVHARIRLLSHYSEYFQKRFANHWRRRTSSKQSNTTWWQAALKTLKVIHDEMKWWLKAPIEYEEEGRELQHDEQGSKQTKEIQAIMLHIQKVSSLEETYSQRFCTAYQQFEATSQWIVCLTDPDSNIAQVCKICELIDEEYTKISTISCTVQELFTYHCHVGRDFRERNHVNSDVTLPLEIVKYLSRAVIKDNLQRQADCFHKEQDKARAQQALEQLQREEEELKSRQQQDVKKKIDKREKRQQDKLEEKRRKEEEAEELRQRQLKALMEKEARRKEAEEEKALERRKVIEAQREAELKRKAELERAELEEDLTAIGFPHILDKEDNLLYFEQSFRNQEPEGKRRDKISSIQQQQRILSGQSENEEEEFEELSHLLLARKSSCTHNETIVPSVQSIVSTSEQQNDMVCQSHGNDGWRNRGLPLIFRSQQLFESKEYASLWGKSHGEALDEKDEYQQADLGKGLDNPKGEYNCFLNVIIQSLWHLETFRNELLNIADRKLFPTTGTDELSDTLLHSLTDVLRSLSVKTFASDEGEAKNAWNTRSRGRELFVVDPASCRHALSVMLAQRGRSQMNEMADASEALNDVLEALHLCLLPERPCRDAVKNTNHDNMNQFMINSIISRTFGFHVRESMQCSVCGYAIQDHTYTRFFHYIPTQQLISAWAECIHQQTPEEILRKSYERDFRTCPKCSQAKDVVFDCVYRLHGVPSIMSLVMGWGSTEALADDISTILSLLPLSLDLQKVYSGVSTSRIYRLRSMVCFYGQHYVLMSYNPGVKAWVQFDDASVKVIGAWPDVEKKCRNGRFQPHVIFYEAVPQIENE